MIKPKNRKKFGIIAVIVNIAVLIYSIYSKQTDVALAALNINALVILFWYTSEGFVEYLLSKKK